MKKNALIFLGLTILLISNIMVWNSPNYESGGLSNLKSIALANSEVDDSHDCWSTIQVSPGSKVLVCGKCCNEDGYTSVGSSWICGGIGSYPDC